MLKDLTEESEYQLIHVWIINRYMYCEILQRDNLILESCWNKLELHTKMQCAIALALPRKEQ